MTAPAAARQVEDRIIITLLRRLRGWNQAEMASRAGLHKSSLSSFEKGRTVPSRAALEKLAAAVGVPMWLIDGALAPVVAVLQQAALAPAQAARSGRREGPADEPGRPLSPADRIARTLYLAGERDAPEARAAAAEAADPWSLLPAAARGEPFLTPELSAGFQHLVDSLCAASEAALPRDAASALGLARLARQVADLAPGDPAARSHAGPRAAKSRAATARRAASPPGAPSS